MAYEVIKKTPECLACIKRDSIEFFERECPKVTCPPSKSKDLALSMKIQGKQKQRIDLFREEVSGLKAELKEAQVPQVSGMNPYILTGIAILAILIVIGVVFIWLKVKAAIDGKIKPIVESMMTDWVAGHTIQEAGSYTNGDFTLTIVKKGKREVQHVRKPEDFQHPHSRPKPSP